MALGSLRADHRNLVVACRRIVERHPAVGPLWWMGARLLVDDDPAELAWALADEIDSDRAERAIASALRDEATVVTIGWPEVAGAALMRRADVHVLCADANHAASSFMQRLERVDVACDPVPGEWLAEATESADLVMIDALAVSERRAIVPLGSRVLAAVAAATDTPVWLATGIGRRLPAEYVDEIATRALPGADDGDEFESGLGYSDVTVEEIPLDAITHVAGHGGVVEMGPGALRSETPFAPELLRTSAM